MTVRTPSSPQYLLNFQVSDKRWYWLKAFALATIKDWEALEKFSKEKRPPTGNITAYDSSFPNG